MKRRASPAGTSAGRPGPARNLVTLAFEAGQGLAKADASQLFRRVAATSTLPPGQLRAELIPDSSWKRAGQRLGPQASQTAARLMHVLSVAERVWGNETDATEWLNSPHPELRGATPLSLLKTEAGGRAVEALLGALEFGFPV
ncbi:MAG: antitoxin Xre/MbcA/ParS toxin-binding domain-containing protein [Terracidiphilus sp.]